MTTRRKICARVQGMRQRSGMTPALSTVAPPATRPAVSAAAIQSETRACPVDQDAWRIAQVMRQREADGVDGDGSSGNWPATPRMPSVQIASSSNLSPHLLSGVCRRVAVRLLSQARFVSDDSQASIAVAGLRTAVNASSRGETAILEVHAPRQRRIIPKASTKKSAAVCFTSTNGRGSCGPESEWRRGRSRQRRRRWNAAS